MWTQNFRANHCSCSAGASLPNIVRVHWLFPRAQGFSQGTTEVVCESHVSNQEVTWLVGTMLPVTSPQHAIIQCKGGSWWTSPSGKGSMWTPQMESAQGKPSSTSELARGQILPCPMSLQEPRTAP